VIPSHITIKEMIYWITGQPSSGKTTLALLLKKHLELEKKNLRKEVFHIDGDDLRNLSSNKDYSPMGRVNNIRNAQMIAKFIHNKDCDVVVSLVAPFLDLREEFKIDLGDNIVEIYTHTTEKRERDHFHVKDYEPPTENYIDIDTTLDSPEESLMKILKQL